MEECAAGKLRNAIAKSESGFARIKNLNKKAAVQAIPLKGIGTKVVKNRGSILFKRAGYYR